MVDVVPKRRVFLSYFHRDDEVYRRYFEKGYDHLFINKSVHPGDLDPDNSAEYIKRLISDDYIRDASIVAVLVGPLTKTRKHVDWEIAAGLNTKVGGRSGLLGILLPTYSLQPNGHYTFETLPPRLAVNAKSGFSPIYTWDWITKSEANVVAAINDAFDRRVSRSDDADNSLPLFSNNREGLV